VDLWATPLGSIALNLAASVLWDGGKLFAGKARSLAADRRALDHLVRAVEERARVTVQADVLRTWLEDQTFWSLLAESGRDERAAVGAAQAFRASYLPDVDDVGSSRVLSVLLIETARTDAKLVARLHEARVENKLDALEVGLGYVFEELLGASLSIQSSVDSGFVEVGGQLADVLDRLPAPQDAGSLEEELWRIVALVEQGALRREAAIQLQIIFYREGRAK